VIVKNFEWDRESVKHELHRTVCKVIFTKVNGEERVMRCTLSESMIPQVEDSNDIKKERKENPEVQRVYDVESNGWRSFRWDSLKSFIGEPTL
jgi:hypothetical protein